MKVTLYYHTTLSKEIEIDDKFDSLVEFENKELHEELMDIAYAEIFASGHYGEVSYIENKDGYCLVEY
jgi:hypothetical protein